MATNFDFNVSPYYDDYNDSTANTGSYHRVLYRPGRGVQARELTTQQHIMQRQIERFGEHVFEQGSKVTNGNASLDKNASYVKLEAQYSGSDITVSNFDSKTFFGKHSLATGRVIKSVANTTTEPNTIFVRYNSGDRINTLFLTGTITGTFLAGEKITGATSSSTGIIRRWDSTNKILWVTQATGAFTAGETVSVTTANGTDSSSSASGALASSLHEANSGVFLDGEIIQNDIPTLTCSAVTGTFEVGDVITGSSSSAKGQILNFDSGAKTIQFVGVSGTFTTSDTVTSVGTAGGFKVSGTASGTVSAVANLTATYNATVGGASGSAITSPTGTGQLFSIQEGVFFVNGFFVKCAEQTIILEKYDNTANKRIGLVISETTVDSDTDSTLVDNAQGYSNQNAAGADRYKIELTLTALDTTATTGDENFIELLSTTEGVAKTIENIPVYSELGRTFARRTNDESGSYTVRDFRLHMEDHASDSTKMKARLSAGKAYVEGFERVSNNTKDVQLDRARTTDTRTSGDTLMQWGNYVIVDGMSGASAQDFFDPTVIDIVDLHCTEYGDITVTSAETYRDTFIGTARVRHVRHDDSSNDPADSSTPGSETYRMYLYDFKFHSILGTAQAGAAGTITLASGEDDTDDAFNGAQIEIYGGTGSGQSRVIKDYVGSTNVATPDVNWTTNPSSDSTYRISFGLKNVQSVVKVTEYDSTSPTAPVLAAKANIANSGRVGSVARQEVYTPTAGGLGADGDAKLFDTENNTMIWPIGESNISEITEDSVTYTIQRKFTDQTISSGAFSITAPANEEFFSGSSALSNSLKNSDYLVVVTAVSAAGSTSLAVGDIIDYTASGRSITPNETNRTVTFEANDGSLGATVDVICKMTIGEGAAAEPKSKAISDFIHLKNVIIDTNNNNIASLGYSDVDTSTVAIYDQSAISSSSPGTDVTSRFIIDSGQKDNIYDHAFIRLKKGQTDPGEVNVKFKRYSHSGNGYFSINSYGGVDYGSIGSFTSPTSGKSYRLSDCIDFRPRRPDEAYTTLSSADTDGQARIDRREFVTTFGTATGGSASTIVLESNTSKTSATDDRYNGAILTIISGTGAGQVRRVHDYTGSSRTVTVDCDFTVNAASGSVYKIEQIEYTKANVELPYPNTNWTADYKYYLPRTDTIFIDTQGNFGAVTGTPALRSKTPTLPDHVMPLYQLNIPAYTNSVSEVQIHKYDTKRYTMRDIGRLEKRINNLEYYTSLNLLEKSAQNMIVKDDQGHDRFKNGMLVDNFSGHSIGDVGHENYQCSIDFQSKILRPKFDSNPVDLSSAYDSGTSSGVTKTGDLITLSFSTENHINQPQATKGVNLNPYMIRYHEGTITLSPNIDTWVDTTTNPTVNANLTGDNDFWNFASNTPAGNAFGTQWNDWSALTLGLDASGTQISEGMRVGNASSNFNAPFLRRSAIEASIRERIPDRFNNSTSGGLEINDAFFNSPEAAALFGGNRVIDANVSPFIRAQTVTVTAVGLKPNTRVYPFFDGDTVASVCTPSGGSAGDPIYTDSNGAISGLSFALPAGTFRTGVRTFKLTDSSSDNDVAATTRADTNYEATGITATLRPPIIIDDTIDPLAQTFFVSENEYPTGIFVPSIDVYFKAKDDQGLPVTMEIREVENGIPTNNLIPLATKTLTPDSVNVSATGPNSDSSVTSLTATTFTFPDPIYLVPGEYCFVLKTASSKYEAWVSEMGSVREDVTGDRKVTQQPYLGSLFKSQNDRTWTPTQWEDIAFVMKKCVFTITGTNYAYFANPASTPSSTYRFDTFRLHSKEIFDGSKTNISWNMRSRKRATAAESSGAADTPSSSTYDAIKQNQNVNITNGQRAIHTTAGSLVLKADFTSTSTDVSPVIDASRLSFVAVENLINNFTTDETNAYATAADGATAPQDSSSGGARSRYISRKVTLEDGFDAQDLQVFLSADKPPSATISVYYKILSADDETNFDENGWVAMSKKTNDSNTSTYNSGEFKEYEFQPSSSPISYTSADNVIHKSFKHFAVKIVMTSSDSNYVPRFANLRAIALDSGRTGLVTFGLE